MSESPDFDASLMDAVRRGASMEEIAALRPLSIQTPEEAIVALKHGNARFFGGQSRRPELSANERRAQIISQSPFAAVIGCSDSRVPVEMVFDQGFGHLFIIRVAGQVITPDTLGSVEFAVEHLGVKLLVVMGHEGCGAVSAAMLPPEKLAEEPENLRTLIERIRPAVHGLPYIRDRKARMREAVTHNVRYQVSLLRRNALVQQAEEKGSIRVIGAYYEIGSGAVDFLTEPEDLAL
ncbi:carbonic anhydrase [Deinobacterium chartae]|uniref:Carbonic anhydrase n=1 Tax=Deinobacterium chartae TaxID=521158 RepID=A0A841HYF7_9DEIO|nr:carbonic anhydrase [Deinobacterium chartae]MBB6097694.1 carbonic anhydrase [Deinobacterium chartae]